ncbi:MAG: vWA domain-containing protein [Polyangia bacterium]
MALFLAACGPNQGRDTSSGGSGKDLSSEHGLPGDGSDDMSIEPSGDFSAQCGVQNFMLQKGLPPEVMIVLDRSSSMTTDFDSGTRWSKVTDAVKQVVTSLQGQIGWGLTVFPHDNDCGTSASVDVAIAPMNATAIGMQISSYLPDGNTPTGDAINKAAAYMASRTTTNPKYLLLSTDGEPNCGTIGTSCMCVFGGTPDAQGQCHVSGVPVGACVVVPTDDGTSKAEAALSAAAAQGIHTFVIGVASDSSDGAELDTLATNGGEPRAGSPKYYAVGSEADLVTAVTTIASQIISCSFGVTTPPPTDQTLVTIKLNGSDLGRDPTHMNGWDFSTNLSSLNFYGAACATLQADPNATVQAIYACPPVN